MVGGFLGALKTFKHIMNENNHDNSLILDSVSMT